MEAHEAASVYSEKKAEVLRNIGQRVEIKDQALVEFMSSMQLDVLTKVRIKSDICVKYTGPITTICSEDVR